MWLLLKGTKSYRKRNFGNHYGEIQSSLLGQSVSMWSWLRSDVLKAVPVSTIRSWCVHSSYELLMMETETDSETLDANSTLTRLSRERTPWKLQIVYYGKLLSARIRPKHVVKGGENEIIKLHLRRKYICLQILGLFNDTISNADNRRRKRI
jgi:hypothetical protein